MTGQHGRTADADETPQAASRWRRGVAAATALTAAAGVGAALTLAAFSAAAAGPPTLQLDADAERHALGDRDAPVTVVEFGDLTCDFTAAHRRDVVDPYLRDLVDDGTVRYVWRDAPLLGEPAEHAAAAVRGVADEQGEDAAWKLKETLLDGEAHGATDAWLRDAAEEVNLDPGDVVDAADRHHEWASGRATHATQLGVAMTPSFLVVGGDDPPVLWQGVQPPQRFVAEAARRAGGP